MHNRGGTKQVPRLQPARLLLRSVRRASLFHLLRVEALSLPRGRLLLRGPLPRLRRERGRLQKVRHRQNARARKLQNQMQARAATPCYAAEEAAPRGTQAEDSTLQQYA